MDATIKAAIAELIGTFVLVFFGVGTAVFTGGDLVATALAFGLTVMVMSVTVGKVSGCHLNTAISLAMFLDKQIDAKKFAFYVVFQIIGAVIAGALIVCLTMGMTDFSFETVRNMDLGANFVHGTGKAWVGILAEVILTFIFVLVVFGATDKSHQGVFTEFGGFFIGLALAMVHMVGIGITGTSVNPARSIGMAIFSADYLGDVWIFIVAPLIGGVLAWLVYSFILRDEAASA
ncbi:MAG: aquaporin [Candidatus Methanomethylophilus sp.]|jgi:aquaporin Z|nr:aquaporin [Methanomethylophilus sp.]MBQ5482739.1 aquaporin [Methanomethylophilus sp.]